MSQAAKGNIMAMICNQYHFSAHPGPRKRNTQKASIFYQQPFGKEEGRTPKSAPLTIYLFKTGLIQPAWVTKLIAPQYFICNSEVCVVGIFKWIAIQYSSLRIKECRSSAIFLCRQMMAVEIVVVLESGGNSFAVVTKTTFVIEIHHYIVREGIGVSCLIANVEDAIVSLFITHVIESTLINSSGCRARNRT